MLVENTEAEWLNKNAEIDIGREYLIAAYSNKKNI